MWIHYIGLSFTKIPHFKFEPLDLGFIKEVKYEEYPPHC